VEDRHGESVEEELLAGMMSPDTIYDSSGDEHEEGRSIASGLSSAAGGGGRERSPHKVEGLMGLPASTIGADKVAAAARAALHDMVVQRLEVPGFIPRKGPPEEDAPRDATAQGAVGNYPACPGTEPPGSSSPGAPPGGSVEFDTLVGFPENAVTVDAASQSSGRTACLASLHQEMMPADHVGGSGVPDLDQRLLDGSLASPSPSVCQREVMSEEAGGITASFRRTVSRYLPTDLAIW